MNIDPAPGTMDTEESELVSVSLNERLNMNIENNTQDIVKDAPGASFEGE